ncbi:uncharacterized protein LOC134738937 [Pongo pygmaeus]|uniref:uncharacterized protein LOC134738937 n=1 Tax=Pongo pygmaeus TaxID=9600 RepID=UPI00300C44D4
MPGLLCASRRLRRRCAPLCAFSHRGAACGGLLRDPLDASTQSPQSQGASTPPSAASPAGSRYTGFSGLGADGGGRVCQGPSRRLPGSSSPPPSDAGSGKVLWSPGDLPDQPRPLLGLRPTWPPLEPWPGCRACWVQSPPRPEQPRASATLSSYAFRAGEWSLGLRSVRLSAPARGASPPLSASTPRWRRRCVPLRGRSCVLSTEPESIARAELSSPLHRLRRYSEGRAVFSSAQTRAGGPVSPRGRSCVLLSTDLGGTASLWDNSGPHRR